MRQVYVTNVVKHFKWERGEKSARRIHKKPSDGEIRACRPWSILRAPDSAAREEAREAFVADLRKVAKFLGKGEREVRRIPKRAD